MSPKAILSIQSHVAYGHVGNAAAVFPLQRLGYEVWPIHTVMFSNHTGYPTFRGPVFSPGDLRTVFQGIAEREVLPGCAAVLSGYMGTSALGEVVLEAVTRVKAANPGAIFCCDPVMGDTNTGLFVREDIPQFMLERAVPAATIVTPNQFELEQLTGIDIVDIDSVLKAAAMLQRLGPELVLVTSLLRNDAPADVIEMVLAGRDGAWLLSTPRMHFPIAPNGSGDAVAALFLGHILRHGSPQNALEAAAEAIYSIFEATAAAGTRELQLIAAQDAIAASRAGGRFKAEKVA